MVTSIVRKVQSLIAASGRRDVSAEIVFPVSSDAITTAGQTSSNGAPPMLPGGLAVVPGAAKGAHLLPMSFNSFCILSCTQRE
jgi:hypothetical protein